MLITASYLIIFKIYSIYINSSVNLIYYIYINLNNFFYNNLILISVLFFFKYLNSFFFYHNFFLIFINFYPSYIVLKWPTTLLIGYNLFHPIILYFSFLLNILYFFILKNTVYYSYRFNFFFISFTLLLGMFWGSIHSSWGFFWSSDYIEYFLLILTLHICFKLHVLSEKHSFFVFKILLVILLLFLLLLRLSIIITIHSFFVNFSIKNVFIFLITLFKLVPVNIYILLIFKLIIIKLLIYLTSLFIISSFSLNKIFLFILHLFIFFNILKFIVNSVYFYSLNFKVYTFFLNFFLNIKNIKISNFFLIKSKYCLNLLILFNYKSLFFLQFINNYFIHMSFFYYYWLIWVSIFKIYKN